MPVHSRVTTPSAFATGKTKRVPVPTGSPVYGEDLFAIKYWNGSSGFYNVSNGIDLQNKGGLVWVKQVGPGGGGRSMSWFDTLSGVQKYYTVGTDFQQSDSQAIVSFNTDGFRIGSHELWNHNCCRYISYTWAKHEKFFTMLTYEGDGSGTRDIAHDLNGELGMVVVKGLSDGGYTAWNGWIVWQRGQNSQTSPGNMHYYTSLNLADGPATDNGYWPNSTNPSDPGMTRTHIRVGNNLNVGGVIYNVYIWGHNEQSEDCIFGPERNKPMIFNGIIPDNSQNFVEQNMGMPVQWLMGKNSGNGDYASAFRVIDKYRGMNATGDCPYFAVRASHPDVQEGSFGQMGFKSARGFTPNSQFGGEGTLYMGIGDSAYKNVSENTTITPTIQGVTKAALFDPPNSTIIGIGGVNGNGGSIGNRSMDMIINKQVTNTSGSVDDTGGRTFIVNRFFSNKKVFYGDAGGYAGTFGDDVGSNANRSRSDGGYYRMTGNPTDPSDASSSYRFAGRPPFTGQNAKYFLMSMSVHRKFFDIQSYIAVAGNKTVYHNLEFEPSMIWIKGNTTADWNVYHKDMGLSYRMALNERTNKVTYSSGQGGIVSVDEEKVVLTNGSLTNDTNNYYTMYLFGEYPTWSKLGSYSGNGSTANIDIDCGFSPVGGTLGNNNGGPSNLLIKRFDSGSDGAWWMYNSRYDPIYPSTVSSGQRAMQLNAIGNQYTTGQIKEWVKRNPGETGFRITTQAGNVLNLSGAEYIYWATGPDNS